MKVLNGRFVTDMGGLLLLMGLLAFSMSSASVSLGLGTDGGSLDVTASAGESTVDVGESTDVTAHVVDGNGDAVANADCTFAVASQPGTDASVDPASGTTDSNGDVTTTLDVGSTPGTIDVDVTCGTTTVTVSVVAGASSNPPASLPTTGAGAGEASGLNPMSLVAAVLSLAGVALMGTGYLARRRQRMLDK